MSNQINRAVARLKKYYSSEISKFSLDGTEVAISKKGIEVKTNIKLTIPLNNRTQKMLEKDPKLMKTFKGYEDDPKLHKSARVARNKYETVIMKAIENLQNRL